MVSHGLPPRLCHLWRCPKPKGGRNGGMTKHPWWNDARVMEIWWIEKLTSWQPGSLSSNISRNMWSIHISYIYIIYDKYDQSMTCQQPAFVRIRSRWSMLIPGAAPAVCPWAMEGTETQGGQEPRSWKSQEKSREKSHWIHWISIFWEPKKWDIGCLSFSEHGFSMFFWDCFLFLGLMVSKFSSCWSSGLRWRPPWPGSWRRQNILTLRVVKKMVKIT